MININNYIIEKLHINKNIKLPGEEMLQKIQNLVIKWFDEHYNYTGFEKDFKITKNLDDKKIIFYIPREVISDKKEFINAANKLWIYVRYEMNIFGLWHQANEWNREVCIGCHE
jgi:hypothetical protein